VECAELQPLLVAYPSPSSLGGSIKPILSSKLVYLHFIWENSLPPLSCGACRPSATVASLPLSRLSGGDCHTHFSSWLVYFQFTWGSAPPPSSGVQGALPFLLRVFFQLFITQFFGLFFLQCLCQFVQGAILIYPRSGCGDTACHLFAHLLVCISQAG
jgi:hypothetical protein